MTIEWLRLYCLIKTAGWEYPQFFTVWYFLCSQKRTQCMNFHLHIQYKLQFLESKIKFDFPALIFIFLGLSQELLIPNPDWSWDKVLHFFFYLASS